MRADADFFCLPVEQLNFDKSNVSIDYVLSLFKFYKFSS